MSKKDYLNSATKKIVHSAAKKMVEEELGVHIDEKQDFFEEIDYDEQTAENKAVEAMGDASLVTDDFGEIHNDFYNPAADMIYLLIWSGLLVGLYFLLKNYVFGDAGAVSFILSAFLLAVSLLLIYEYFTIKRKRTPVILMSIYAWCGTGVFLYLLIDELNIRFNSSFSAMWNFITKTELSYQNNNASLKALNYSSHIVDAVLVIGILIAIIYQAKYIRNNQNRIDNKIRRWAMKVIRYIACVFLAAAIFFGIKGYFDIQTLHNGHIDAYNTAIEISETCTNREEVLDYINSSDLDFEIEKDTDGNITGCTYSRNYTLLIISFNDTDAESEYKSELGEITDDEELSAAIESMYDNESKDIYTIELITDNVNYFEKNYDSLTLSRLCTSKSDEEALCSFVPADHKIGESYEYYKSIYPQNLKIYYTDDKIFNRQYKFIYMRGSEGYNYQDEFTAYAGDNKENKIDEFYKKREEILSLIKENPSISSKDLAKKTGAKIDAPEISKEEYMESVNMLGSYFDASKKALESIYDLELKYVVNNDWYFNVIGSPVKAVLFVIGNDYRILDYINENDSYHVSSRDGYCFKKVYMKGGYFDREGDFYRDAERVPYYNSDGKKFYFYTKTVKTGDTSIGDFKEYYITDRRNVYYELDSCYIDENGFLYYDSYKKLKKIDEEHYKSSSGKGYTKLGYTSWDSQGNIILPSDVTEQ